MNKKYIIALDQGTTSSRAVIFDHDQNIVAIAQKEFKQIYPNPGWVEHDAIEIFESQDKVLHQAISQSGIKTEEIAAIGITNQRETTIVWDRETGLPIYNAIVWQCRRTAPICEELKAEGLSGYIKKTTGLVVDAYFSATKIKWILDNVPGAKEKAQQGKLAFGTVDSWLVWRYTNGKCHITDVTNASRTMLYNIRELKWDENLCEILGIPLSMLPDVRSSSELYGELELDGCMIPISGIAGDQQAALFGQNCFDKGEAKNTYGTGCFLLMNTGNDICYSDSGLLTTIAIGLNGEVKYALEGSVFTGGAVVQWLRDEMHLINDARDTEYFATKVEDSGGVYIVPAFTGLGAPYWDMYARGTILGITRGTRREHIIRAALESVAFQSNELLCALQEDSGIIIKELRVDGGASANNFLMQFQSNVIGKPVRRPMIRETTALGAAYLAGLGVGFWKDLDELKNMWSLDKLFEPTDNEKNSEAMRRKWKKAVERSLAWEERE
ncbi:MAG: glycerol kinase GlpK [Clostridia bacterium]|nr:glycerol kinase GlpK [Clostridia bacterium]